MEEMRIREFSSWSIERGNFLLYFFLFFFFTKNFSPLVSSLLRRIAFKFFLRGSSVGKVNLYNVNEGYAIETISSFFFYLETIQYNYNWHDQFAYFLLIIFIQFAND